MIHINEKAIFYTHVEQISAYAFDIKYYKKQQQSIANAINANHLYMTLICTQNMYVCVCVYIYM